jgi:hypothetical protein
VRTTELHPAFSWDCDDCGAENFARCIVPEMSDEDLKELREDHGIQPWETGDLLMMPTEVTCSKCGAAYATLRSGEATDQDED